MTTWKKLLMAALLVCSVYCPAAAQEDTSANKWTMYPNNIGAAGGFTTGYGLSYRRWAKNGMGFQCTFLPYYLDTKESTTQRFSVGLTALKRISATRYVNFFAYASLHKHYYSYEDKTSFASLDDSESATMTAIGIGPGMDFKTTVDRFLISCMIGLGYYTSADETMLNATGEIAVFYSF
jgi:hypothetical protein